MAQINFDEVFNTLKQGVTSLAQTTIKGYVSEAESDGQDMLNQMKANLQTWTTQFTNNQISQAELTDLIGDQRDDLQMAALTQIGIAEADLDNFKSGIISLIENTIFGLV